MQLTHLNGSYPNPRVSIPFIVLAHCGCGTPKRGSVPTGHTDLSLGGCVDELLGLSLIVTKSLPLFGSVHWPGFYVRNPINVPNFRFVPLSLKEYARERPVRWLP